MTPTWVPFVAALAGAVAGGGATLFAGYRADLREARRQKAREILRLGALLLAESGSIGQQVADIQGRVRRKKGFTRDDPRHVEDMRALQTTVREANKYIDNLQWLLVYSPLHFAVVELQRNGNALFGVWSADYETYEPVNKRFDDSLTDLRTGLQYFANLTPTVQVEYLNNTQATVFAPPGLRPPDWPKPLGRGERFTFWRRNFFLG